MKYLLYSFIIVLCFLLSSCRDEIIMPISENTSSSDTSVILDNLDIIYLQQTDKTNMLYSLIRWDDDKNMYILDLSDNDRESLDIDKSLYEETNDMINNINSLN